MSSATISRGELRTVFVSRHARTDANETGVLQGWGPWALSANGRADVRAAHGWWRQFHLARIVSSPLERATQTALELFGR